VQATKYLRGLLSQVARKNSWQVAEAIGDRIPDATQRLLYQPVRGSCDWPGHCGDVPSVGRLAAAILAAKQPLGGVA
jgi:hypothetical protein